MISKINSKDETAIFDLFSNDLVVKYYDMEALANKEQANELITFFQSRFDAATGIRWAIRMKESNKLIGTCGFNVWNARMRSAVIGYDLIPSLWGKGLASEAIRRIIDAAFSCTLACGPIHRIQADTVPGNIASEKLLISLGFKEEGLRRESGYWKERYHDLKCFGLLKTEFSR